MSKKIIGLLCVMLSLALTARPALRAEDRATEISGKITDGSGQPLPGVFILEKGSINGTSSDAEGLFSITVSPESILVITCLGFDDMEMPASEADGNVIQMNETINVLNETVVVGYAVQKQVNLTGAVSSVAMDEVLDGRPITNLSSGLSGLSAGLYVNQSTGRPNADGATLLIRGRGTLNNASPLVIIDGMEGDISSVNPQDVESVSVLKDASSSAIYGSRAANGVVLITTRKGSEGRFRVNYDGYMSVARPTNVIETVSDYADYMDYYNEALYNTDPTAQPQYSQEMINLWRNNKDNPLMYPNTDWTKEIFQTGISHNHNLSFSAGSDRISVYGSLGYLNNPGIVENSAFERFNARLNVSAKVTRWLTLGANISGRASTAEMGSKNMSGMFDAVGMPGMTYRAPDGRYGGVENPEENAQRHSPLYLINKEQGDINSRSVNTRFTAKIDILKNLSVEGSLNYSYAATIEEAYPQFEDLWSFRTNTIVYANSDESYVYNANSNNQRFLGDLIVRYNTDFTDKLHFGFLAGTSSESYVEHSFNARKYDLLDDRLTVINGATGSAEANGNKADWAMLSFFGRVNLSWADKYLFEANLRSDGSSRFRPGKTRWGIFPSFSLGWRISEEQFMKSAGWVDQLKLRASWGSLGNNAVGNYEWQSVYTSDNYVLGNNVAQGVAQLALANSAITWETTYVTNAGVDFAFFNSRFTGTLDFFDKNTQNILIDLPAPLLVGNAAIPTQNAAAVNNRGFEVSLKWRDRVGDFNYFIGGNVSWTRNIVTKYKGDEATISGANMIKEGYPINVQYVLAVDRIIQTYDDELLVKQMQNNAPIDPATGQKKNPFAAYGTPQKGDFLYKDLNGDGIIDENDRYAVGNGNTPPWVFGLQFGFDWKGLDLSLLLQGTAGLKVLWMDRFNMGYLTHGSAINKEIAEGAWRDGRTDATFPRLLTRTNAINNQPSDFWVEDKSYMRLKNIQIGYTLPSKWMQKIDVSRLRIYISGENLFTLTGYRGIDPEVSGTTYPNLRQYMVGINLSF